MSFKCSGLPVKFQTIMLNWKLSNALQSSAYVCSGPLPTFLVMMRSNYIFFPLYQRPQSVTSKAGWLQWQQQSKFNIPLWEGKRIVLLLVHSHSIDFSPGALLPKNVHQTTDSLENRIQFLITECNSNLGTVPKLLGRALNLMFHFLKKQGPPERYYNSICFGCFPWLRKKCNATPSPQNFQQLFLHTTQCWILLPLYF